MTFDKAQLGAFSTSYYVSLLNRISEWRFVKLEFYLLELHQGKSQYKVDACLLVGQICVFSR